MFAVGPALPRPPERSRRPSSGKRRAATPVAPSGSPASILLVDDHPSNLIALEAILEPLGERLVLASSGSEAVAIAEHEDFALVLLDLQMPRLDGLETAALLKKLERCQAVPIIILTADEPSRDTVAKGYASGAVDFLYKPLDPDLLRSKVSVFVALHHQRHDGAPSAVRTRAPEPERIDDRLIAAELAELELRAAEARMRLVLESAGLGTFEHNPQMGTLRCDAHARALFGFDADEPLDAATFLGAIHPDDQERVASETARAMAPGAGGTYELEYRVQTAGAGTRWVAARGRAFVQDGHAVRIIGTLLDITARKTVEKERAALLEREQQARAEAENAVARAEEASRAKDEFLATVSHELRNPLNAILGWSRVLLEDGDRLAPARRRKGLEVIARNTKAQVQLVEDILEVSRIVSGKLRLKTRPTDVRAVVEAACDTVRAAAQAKGVVLEVRVAADAGVIVADEDRVQQILWNLLANAVKFTPRGGHVDLVVTRTAREVVLSVTDSGEGIESGFLPFVFDRFRQADGTTTRQHGGLGLGLSIVRHLVELHGGTAAAASAGVGTGATFTVTLPLEADAPFGEEAVTKSTASPSARSHVATGRLAGVRVLVLDDDEDMRDLIGMILEDAGARVTQVGTVRDALVALVAELPDVAVSDLAMPGEDGYAFVTRARASKDARVASIPLVAMTAYARAEDRHRVLDAGFVRHIAKPIEPSELVETLAEVITAARQEAGR
ncbi:MAG: hypothetical protein JWP97_718 [Labilithrix sp.]|nr:hypothetical protein [Labilithrix sp.]